MGDAGTQVGALAGVTVIDVSTMGPGPYASMVLSDFGANVVEIRRPGSSEIDVADKFVRGKRQLTIDLRAPGGADLIAQLTDHADVFLEGYRPGTMERRGLGPEVLMARNTRLIYTRLTGWGQTGPYAAMAGHDINYVGISGILGALGDDSNACPVPTLNLMGDFAGGSVPAVLGTVLALLSRERTGRGQVVDAAMVDGAAYLLFAQFADMARGDWKGRGSSVLSGIAPFFRVYRCADGGFVSVGSIEQKFYTLLIATLGLSLTMVDRQNDRSDWPAACAAIAAVFAGQPRQHWVDLFDGSDACVLPVLELDEIASDPHVQARGCVVLDADGHPQVAPAPRLSETPGTAGRPPATSRQSQLDTLTDLGLSADDIERYQSSGALQLATRT